MTGKLYYLTTLGAWREHSAHFATSHFIALESPGAASPTPTADPNDAPVEAGHAVPGETSPECNNVQGADESARPAPFGADGQRILVLVEADEGAHLALEDDARFDALPHPLVQKPISHATRAALAAHDVPYGATTFDVAEAVSRAHPLLRHRVF